MGLDIFETRAGNSLILKLVGQLVHDTPNSELRNAVRNGLKAGVSVVTFDLSELQRLDSIGIGELISSMIAVSREGARFVLLNPSDRNSKLLAISGMTDIFEVKYG